MNAIPEEACKPVINPLFEDPQLVTLPEETIKLREEALMAGLIVLAIVISPILLPVLIGAIGILFTIFGIS